MPDRKPPWRAFTQTPDFDPENDEVLRFLNRTMFGQVRRQVDIDPEFLLQAVTILRQSNDHAVEQGEACPPDDSLESLVHWVINDFLDAEALISGIPQNRVVRRGLEQYQGAVRKLRDLFENLDQLSLSTLSRANKLKGGDKSWARKIYGSMYYGEPNPLLDMLRSLEKDTEAALSPLPQKTGGRGNALKIEPKRQLVSASIKLFDLLCPSAVSSSPSSVFCEFIALMHEIVTGEADDCDYYVREGVSEFKRCLRERVAFEASPDGIYAKIVRSESRCVQIENTLDPESPLYADNMPSDKKATLQNEHDSLRERINALHAKHLRSVERFAIPPRRNS